jgi:hypothetical protein
MSNTVSTNSIKAQIPHPVLTRVLGEPTHKQLKLILRKLTTNLMAVSCPWGHNKGHPGLLQDPALYLAQNGASFDIPAAEPPLYPVVPAVPPPINARNYRHRTPLHAKHGLPTALSYRLVRTITHNQFDAAINKVFYAFLDNPIEGLNGIDLHTLVQHILITYAQIGQPNLDVNLANFNMEIGPGLPLAVYMRKQERCQVLAIDTAVPIFKATMVTTRAKHALVCGNMTMAWHKWNHCAIANHTWSKWKTHWTAAFAKMHDINRMTVGEAAFSTNAAEEEHQTRQITALLKNLTNALIQKNVTINNLVASNTQLVQDLQEMQAAMVHMVCAGQPHPTPYQAPTSYQPPAWVPNPPEAAAPPAASPAPTLVTRSPHPSHWGSVKPT